MMLWSRRREEGGVALMVALITSVVAALVLVVLHAGKLIIAQQELTSLADAAALTGAAVLRERGAQNAGSLASFPGGPEVDVSEQLPLLQEMNTKLPAQARISVLRDPGNDDRVFVRADVTASYVNPFALLGRRAFQLRAFSHAMLNEWGRHARWPAMVLVVDASCSMGDAADGSCKTFDPLKLRFNPCDSCPGRTLWDVTKDVITEYAASGFPVRTGLVVFARDVRATVEPPEANVANVGEIRAALDGTGPGPNTDLETGLNRARQMLEEPHDSVILITDGAATGGGTEVLGVSIPEIPIIGSPFWTSPDEAARSAAEEARGIGSVFSVDISTGGSGFMRDVAGGAGTGGGDRAFYYGVRSIADMADFTRALTRRTCMFGNLPDSTASDWCETNRIGAVLSDPDGEEEGLEQISADEVDASTTDHAFACLQSDRSGAYIQLSAPTCARLTGLSGRQLLVRWGGARLTCRPQSQSLVDCLEE